MKIIYLSIVLLLTAAFAYADNPYWCIQVIRCSELENAKATYDKLGSYEDKRIEKSKGSYAVSIGHYRTKEKSLASLAEIRAQFNDAFIRRCGNPNSQIIENTKTPKKQKEVTSKTTPSKPGKGISKITSLTTETHKLPSTAEGQKSTEAGKKSLPDSLSAKNKKLVKQEAPIPEVIHAQPVSEKKNDTVDSAKMEKTEPLKVGMQHYYNKEYKEAIGSLTQYISLSPKSEHCSAALFIVGKSLEEMGNPLSALNIFGRILGEYPKSPEAFTGMIAMADISVRDPSLKYPVFMKGAEYVKDPILAYDKALQHQIPDQMAEAIRFKKGRALWKQGHYQNSYDCLSSLIYDAPQTVYKNDIMDIMKANAVTLIDDYHQAGDHIATINLFFEAKDKNLIDDDDTNTMLQSSLSLAHMGMYDISTSILDHLRSKTRLSKSSTILESTAEKIEKIRLNNHASHFPAEDKWALYESGKKYLKADDLPMAQKKLSELKNAGGEPFWSKITDYALEDDQWNKKYRDYLNKKQ